MPAFFFSLLVLLASTLDLQAQSTESTVRIVTVSGEEYWGTIVEESSDTIKLTSESGIVIAIPRTSTRLIEFSPADSDAASKGYWSFGGTLGTPSGLNLVLARNINRNWGVRLSGLYLGRIAGIELDGTRRIGGSGSFSHNVHLGVGTMALMTTEYTYYGVIPTTDEWTYVVGGYDLNWGGFHTAVGLSVGTGSFSNPQLMFQVGYVHQFK